MEPSPTTSGTGAAADDGGSRPRPRSPGRLIRPLPRSISSTGTPSSARRPARRADEQRQYIRCAGREQRRHVRRPHCLRREDELRREGELRRRRRAQARSRARASSGAKPERGQAHGPAATSPDQHDAERRSRGWHHGVITVGGIYDETGPIDATVERDTVRSYFNLVNSQGGVNGYKLQLIDCDSKYDPSSAHQCAQKLISQGVLAIVGWLSLSGEQNETST